MKMILHAMQIMLATGATKAIAPSLYDIQDSDPENVPPGYRNPPKPLSKKQKAKRRKK